MVEVEDRNFYYGRGFLRFLAHIQQLRPMLQWVQKELAQLSLPSSALKKIELASEEALVNIIHHAYKNRPGEIDLTIAVTPHRIEIVIQDQGPPFNPLQREAALDPALPLEEREIGGLGIPLMRQCMDEVHYRRSGSWNVLTLVKKI